MEKEVWEKEKERLRCIYRGDIYRLPLRLGEITRGEKKGYQNDKKG